MRSRRDRPNVLPKVPERTRTQRSCSGTPKRRAARASDCRKKQKRDHDKGQSKDSTEVALLEPLVVCGSSGSRDVTSPIPGGGLLEERPVIPGGQDRTRRTIAAPGEKRCSPKTRCEGQECSAGSHFGRVEWLFGSQTCRIRSAWLAKERVDLTDGLQSHVTFGNPELRPVCKYVCREICRGQNIGNSGASIDCWQACERRDHERCADFGDEVPSGGVDR